MLGEGARTESDAERYLAGLRPAIDHCSQFGRAQAAATAERDGISIKLSALHPRYEDAQRDRVFAELVPRVQALIDLAAPPTST
jgi:RHH-type proline utilization regulon transcriptional repressor/proline dehydrogenase/delta 1-pyrroline-5-carboxylate dehydrogenase